MPEPSSAALSHDRRVDGLRNLRIGYESVPAAVGFWHSLHGEDLIEVYAGTAAALRELAEVVRAEFSNSDEDEAAHNAIRTHEAMTAAREVLGV